MSLSTFLRDPAAPALPAVPGSFRVGTQLMQDTVSAAGLAVPHGAGKVALFANPFQQNREEALILDPNGNVNYLQRSARTATGWDSTKVYAAPGQPVQAQQVVVAVHPSGTVWAFCVPPASGTQVAALVALRLGLSADGVTSSWTVDQGSVLGSAAWESVGVSYAPGAGPLVYGGRTGATTGGKPFVQTISAVIPAPGSAYSWLVESAVPHAYGQGALVGAGFRAYSQAGRANRVNVFYLQQGSSLYRLDQPLADPGPVAPFTSQAGELAYNTRRADGSWAAAGFQPVPGTGLSNGSAMESVWLSACAPGALRSGNTKKPVYACVADGSVYVDDPNGPTGGWEEVPEFGSALQTWGVPVQVEIAGLPDGTWRLLARGLDSGVYFYDRTLIPGTQQAAGWTQVPGLQPGSGPQSRTLAVTGMADGSVQVLVQKTDTTLVLGRWRADNSWSAWVPVPGVPANTYLVALAGMADGSTQATANSSGGVYHAVVSATGAWSAWNRVADAGVLGLQAPVSIAALPDGQSQLVGVSNGSVLHRMRSADGNWSPSWATVPGAVPGQYQNQACIVAGADGSTVVISQARGAAQLVSSDVKQFCGVWNLPDMPHGRPQGDVGCVYLNGNGDVVTGYLSASTNVNFSTVQFMLFPVVGLEFDQAASWQDADGMLHVYANAGGDLRVMHQNGWTRYSYLTFDRLMPSWIQTTAVKLVDGQAVPLGFKTTVATGLRSNVAGFWLDAYPDYKPSELVQSAEKRAEEAYSILTQDLTSTTWVDDSVRLPDTAAGDPYIVSRYVADATLLDSQGTAMPQHTVTVTALELTQIYLHGVSYLVGPGKAVKVDTDLSGKLTISVDADNLTPPKVALHADGLANSTVIDFGTDVNTYLSGTGTLPSQSAVFNADALKNAQVHDNAGGTGTKLVPDDRWTPDLTPGVVVSHCQQVYALADGTQPATFTMMFEGFTTPQPVIGYVFQNWDPDRPQFQAFRTTEDLEAYRAYRENHRSYGGFWDDFLHWAGDVWEGIKTAATKIAEVLVDIGNKIVEIAIRIGEAVVSLGKMIIEAVEQAARAVEAVFQMIADAVVRVIEWLKSLFSFKDIWDTKTALQTMVRSYIPWLSEQITSLEGRAHGWFVEQEAAVDDYFDLLKAQFGDARLGDAKNKVPTALDAGGAPISQDSLQSNPQANWMMNQIGIQGTASPEALAFVFESDPISDAFQAFTNAVTSSGALDNFSRACAEVQAAIESLLLSGDGSPVVHILDAFQSLVKALLQTLDAIVAAMLTFAKSAVTGLDAFLFAPQPQLGIINLIYRWVQQQADVPASDIQDVSIGGLFLLVAGFMGTVVYKLAMGVDNPPFPGGYAPSIFTAADPADGALVQGSKDANIEKMKANIALNIACAVLGAGANFLSDIGQDEKDTPLGKFVQAFVITTSIMGAIVYFPLLSGDEADTPGIVQCVGWGFYALLNVGSAIPFAGRTGSAFKNLLDRTAGPGVTTVIGLGLLGVAVWDCVSSQADPMTWSSDIFGCTSMTFQFLRTFKVWHLDAAVTAIDALSNVITYTIPGVAAMCELGGLPQITAPDGSATLTGGTVGMTYSSALTASSYYIGTGYGRSQNWAVVQNTALPPGLALDPNKGIVSGTPTLAGKNQQFTVQCSDSFGPPGYSDPTPLTLTVAETQATGVTPGAPAEINVGTVAANLLSATVTGANGPLQGYTVRFTAPPTGSSGVFPASTSSADLGAATATIDVTTDANGRAVAPFYWANGTTGAYSVTVEVPGVPLTRHTIAVTNKPLTGATVSATAPSNSQTLYIYVHPNEEGQLTEAGPFPYPLTAKVTDAAGQPLQNVVVTFNAPSITNRRSYGTFVDNSGTTISTATDADGFASSGVFSGATINLAPAPTIPFTVQAVTDFGPHADFKLTYQQRW
jgi:hypothetical protein